MKSNLDIGQAGQTAAAKEAFKRAFGRKLRQLMIAKGLTQSDLARAAGVGRDMISTAVNGRSFPEPVNLNKIAQALGMTSEELLPDHIDHADAPEFVLRQSRDDPSLVTLTINRPIPLDLAAEIVARLKAIQ